MREVAAVFLKLGVIGFGGPAAHIAMFEEEVVTKRRWLDREHFLDLLGLTNLIPGPNSTEMAIHLGWLRAGWRGLLLGGLCFLAPAIGLTTLLAWVYATWGDLAAVRAITGGIQPAVLAVILAAGARLGGTALEGPAHLALGAIVAVAVLCGVDVIWALVAGAVLGTVTPGVARCGGGLLALLAAVDLPRLGLVFLKVGSVLYGSGYVLVAFLEDELVEGYGWLTESQLLDAIAIGQFTPGPVLSTATFIGYQVAGGWGAVVATAGIFAPSFVLVALLGPFARRLRGSPRAARFLASVRVASVALLAAVLVQLGARILVAPVPISIAAAAAVAALVFRVGAMWLVLGGGIAGWLCL